MLRLPFSMGSTGRWTVRTVLFLAALVALSATGRAQLNGTYTVGTGGTYSTIDAAITALSGVGVSGPVTFSILSGTYSPTSGYYTLGTYTGMSATNTVTFTPAAGASVTITNNNNLATFQLIGGQYYIFHGGASRTMTISNTGYGPAFWLTNGSHNNIIRNCVILGAHGATTHTSYTSNTIGAISLSYSYTFSYPSAYSSTSYTGNSPGNNNKFIYNIIGDPTGAVRQQCGIKAYGYTGTGYLLNGTIIDSNEVWNFGQLYVSGTTAYMSGAGIQVAYGVNTRIMNNTVQNTGTGASGTAYTGLYSYCFGITKMSYPYISYYSSGNCIDTISNNTITSLITWGSGPVSSFYNYHYGLYCYTYFYPASAATQLCTNSISNNRIYNLLPSSITSPYYSYCYAMYNIFYNYYGSTNTSVNNIMYNQIYNTNNSTTPQYAYTYGMYNYYYNYYGTNTSTGISNVFNNTMYNLIGCTSPYYAYCYGMYPQYMYHYQNAGIGTLNMYNNRMYNLVTSTATGACYQYGIYPYAYYYYGTGSGTSKCSLNMYNNMISINGDQQYSYSYHMYPYVLMYYPSNASDSVICNIEHNTIHTRGTGSGGYYNYNLYTYVDRESSTSYAGATKLRIRNNIISSSRNISYSYLQYFNGYNYITGVFDNVIDNNLYYKASSGYMGYYYYYDATTGSSIGGTYTDLPTWRSATSKDANSVMSTTAIPYVDEANGNLHLSTACAAISQVEGKAVPAGYATDIDGDARYTLAPDIGADEGAFNGGGILVTYPNGGESIVSNGPATVTFTTNRPLNVNIQISTDNGVTWAQVGLVNPTLTGPNSFTITTPNVVTSLARVRVMSNPNPYSSICEGDTSNAPFSLVLPILNMMWPAGGEVLTGGDLYSCPSGIRWNSQYVPPGMYVHLDYSTDNGLSWVNIAQNLASPNNVTNCYPWLIPTVIGGTTQARVRVRIGGPALPMAPGVINSVSANKFTILETPRVTVTSPNGGEQIFVGQPFNIRWTSVTTDNVKIEYSPNLGTTWFPIVDNVPAYLGTYQWSVPGDLTASQLCSLVVRITNQARTQYFDISDGAACGLISTLNVTAPCYNQYELSQTMTAQWTYKNVQRVRVDYSPDGGVTWSVVAPSLTMNLTLPNNGSYSYSFVPPGIPTQNGIVRVTNLDRQDVSSSSCPNTILPGKSIVIFAPAGGEELVRNTVTTIRWKALRLNAVNIKYSLNGGTSWITLATNVQADNGMYLWTVPNTLTTTARVRIEEVGGNVYAETDVFSIVATSKNSDPVLRLTSPNGGESYQGGQTTTVTWTSTNVQNASLFYSNDGGATWKFIVGGVLASTGQYNWKVPTVPGTQYRVKIEASQANDMSDNNFTVTSQLNPGITVIYPNGGETFTTDSVVNVQWTERDLNPTSQTTAEFSPDNGATWQPIGNVPAGTNTIQWTIPMALKGGAQPQSTDTKTALVRVSNGPTSDQSNAVFTIKPKATEPIRVLAPNGGEVWDMGTKQDIKWSAPADVTAVHIELSKDGGATWADVAANAPSVPGNQVFKWTVPDVTANVPSCLIKISDVAIPSRTDQSDATFTIKKGTGAVIGEATTGSGSLRLLGNFPNPFASKTELRWSQARSANVVVRLFDQNGRTVVESKLGLRNSGDNRCELSVGTVPSGVYMYEIQAGNDVARSTVMVVR